MGKALVLMFGVVDQTERLNFYSPTCLKRGISVYCGNASRCLVYSLKLGLSREAEIVNDEHFL